MIYDLWFHAYGTPAPKGSKEAYGNGRVESSKGVKPFEESIGWAAKMAIKKLPPELAKQFPLQGPLVAKFVFTVKRSTNKLRADAPSVRPDLSKYIRAAEDGCNKLVWADDGNIVQYDTAAKTYPGRHPGALDKPGVLIAVRRATHEELGLSLDSYQGKRYSQLLHMWGADLYGDGARGV